MCQSSNDCIPSAIHVSAVLASRRELFPALEELRAAFQAKEQAWAEVLKTGRTHLMDAMPMTLGQEASGWRAQIELSLERLRASEPRLLALAQGGTAIGTGINAHPEFAARFAEELRVLSSVPFKTAANLFAAQATQDAAVEYSGQLRTLAVSLMKIANDLRWMGSGPLAGLAELALPALQPGSSIMPGKVNPVIPEAVSMIAAQVMGLDAAIAIAGQSGNFQLNVMLPLIASNLLTSIHLLANGARSLARQCVAGLEPNTRAAQRGAGAQSDPGHGLESRDRLRKGRGDRQACLCGGPAGAGCGARDVGPFGSRTAPAARSCGRHSRWHARRRRFGLSEAGATRPDPAALRGICAST